MTLVDRRKAQHGAQTVRPKILLVDDDEINLILTEAALGDDYEVKQALSGEDALRTLGAYEPDLIVLDAIMPGLDGFETCRELRTYPGFENVPVLILTGLEDDASIQRAFDAGANDFFVKTIQWSLLRQRIQALLRMAHTHHKLLRSQMHLARAQDLARMGSFEWAYDGAGRFDKDMVLHEQALRVFGLGPDEHLSFREFLHMVEIEERRQLVATLRKVLRENGTLNLDVRVELHDGRQKVVHLEGEPEFGNAWDVRGYLGIIQDVTDRRNAEDSIRRLASTDALTTLPNRRQLMIRADRAVDAARRLGHPCALLMIDLDRFKNINDTLGHFAGDELLIEVATRLRSCLRHSDTFSDGFVDPLAKRSSHRSLEAVARLGGDEFVALLPEIGGPEDAEMVAFRILAALREPIAIAGQECFATGSVGIAIFPRDGDDVADLMRNADVAMYAAKKAGRNACVQYSPQISTLGPERLALETALHKALERNELRLYYQPKVDVSSHRIVGVEALMRWQRGDTLVPPDDFIPIAEETGLIVPMSEWLLMEAGRQSKQWFDQFGWVEPIAVNLPSRMFHRRDLIQLIQQATEAHDLPAPRLQLELTEGTLMDRMEEILPMLHQINGLGVKISVDDFGTGYSSLAYLTTLPISELKIDKSFVRKLGDTSRGTAVITTIVALARALGLSVVAEGVESLSQQHILHRQGCSIMQGYLFSKPIDGEAMGRWIQDFLATSQAQAALAQGLGFEPDLDAGSLPANP